MDLGVRILQAMKAIVTVVGTVVFTVRKSKRDETVFVINGFTICIFLVLYVIWNKDLIKTKSINSVQERFIIIHAKSY